MWRCASLYVQYNTYSEMGVRILIVMATVIPQASWLLLSWSLRKMEGSASCMMTAMPPVSQ